MTVSVKQEKRTWNAAFGSTAKPTEQNKNSTNSKRFKEIEAESPQERLLWQLVGACLPFKDLCAFYRVSKCIASSTQELWKKHRQVKRIPSFIMCKALSQRGQFLFGAAIVKYISLSNQIKTIEDVSKAQEKFDCITKRFPHFAQIMREDLDRRVPGAIPDLVIDPKLNHHISYGAQTGGAGETLLYGWQLSATASSCLSYTYLLGATYNDITVAALYGVRRFLDPERKSNDDTDYFSLALACAATQQHDFRPAEELLKLRGDLAETLCEELVEHRQQHASWAATLNMDVSRSEWTNYILAHSAPVLAHFGRIKLRIGKWKTAACLFEKALSAYGDQAPFEVLIAAGRNKILLKEFHEADTLFQRALAVRPKDTNISNKVRAYMAYTKSELNQWEKADRLFAKSFNTRREMPHWFYHADTFYSKAQAAGYTLRHSQAGLARAYFKAGNYTEADRLLTQIIDSDDIRILEMAAAAKMHLKQYSAADQLFNRWLDLFRSKCEDEAQLRSLCQEMLAIFHMSDRLPISYAKLKLLLRPT